VKARTCGCTRCGTGIPVVVRVVPHPGVLVEVRLCPDCRRRAAAENRTARARNTGSVPGPA
jgi:hypothetical protein